MPLFDIFKKPKQKPEKPLKKEAEKKLPEEKLAVKPGKSRKSSSGVANKILKEPHVSEKATDLTKQDWYAFKVYPEANKTEIKKAVEDLYGVSVVSVGIINIPKKKRRLGRVEGWRKGYKKAVVRLKAGQKIEVLPR